MVPFGVLYPRRNELHDSVCLELLTRLQCFVVARVRISLNELIGSCRVVETTLVHLVGAYDGKYVSFDVNIQLKYQLDYTTNEQLQIEKFFERIEIIIIFPFLHISL